MDTKSLFFKLLSAKSVTPNDDGLMEFIKSYMSGFKAKELDINGVKNLFLSKKFSDTDTHICFAGHIDVVPAGENWDSDPFTPTLKDGFVYARGTQDMKSGVCAFLQACKSIDSFDGTLSILLTSDEEGDAKYGTIEVLKYLKESGNLPTYALIAEPTCEELFGDTIKIGRRGSINGKLTLKGLQGHAAYPHKTVNPIHQIAPLLTHLCAHFFDEGDEFFAPSQMVITDIRSGYEVTNLTPDSLKLMFNVRNSTKTSVDDIKNYIDTIFDNLEYELTIKQSAKPFLTDKNSKIVKNLQNAIEQELNAIPKLSTGGGTSDARFFGEFNIPCIEFGVKNDTIHAPNERCSLGEVEKLTDVFISLIKNFKKGWKYEIGINN